MLYLDRVCTSQAIVPIQRELGLTNSRISYVLMAFTLAYGLFEVPAGRLEDHRGSRAVLTRIVVWWSAFTALTGACPGFLTLLLVRFLFGAGEAGAFPNAARVIARWYPARERGRVQGVMLAAAQFGATLAPAAAAHLIESAGWRWSFAAFGLTGVAWVAGCWQWFRDDPAEHPAVNAAELALIRAADSPPPVDPGPVPWRAVVRNRGIIVLGLIMILGSFYTYFFYSWFPKYLSAARDVDDVRAGSLAMMVRAGSGAGMLHGGGGPTPSRAGLRTRWRPGGIWASRVTGPRPAVCSRESGVTTRWPWPASGAGRFAPCTSPCRTGGWSPSCSAAGTSGRCSD